jgi:hypothetical protein
MGQESNCKLEHDGRTYEGKALLETSELIFRGGTRLKIPFREMSRVEASDGRLLIASPQGQVTFHLGDAAAKWASKILNPPSRLDKLGVKAATRIHWIGAPDPEFKREAEQRGAAFVRTRPDLTFVAAASLQDLAQLEPAAAPVWVVYPKGVSKIREIDVLQAGRQTGLVDIKVASFSPTHTALKFVKARADNSPARA